MNNNKSKIPYIKKNPRIFKAIALKITLGFDILINTSNSTEPIMFFTNFFIIFKVCSLKFTDLFGNSKFLGKVIYKT